MAPINLLVLSITGIEGDARFVAVQKKAKAEREKVEAQEKAANQQRAMRAAVKKAREEKLAAVRRCRLTPPSG